jgi:hypothetical protein
MLTIINNGETSPSYEIKKRYNSAKIAEEIVDCIFKNLLMIIVPLPCRKGVQYICSICSTVPKRRR